MHAACRPIFIAEADAILSGDTSRPGGASTSRPPDEFADEDLVDRYPEVKWRSTEHRMTHLPMLPDCPICQRANKKRKQHRTRANPAAHSDAMKFGDVLTMDFLSAHADRIPGLAQLNGDEEALGGPGRRHRVCRGVSFQEKA